MKLHFLLYMKLYNVIYDLLQYKKFIYFREKT